MKRSDRGLAVVCGAMFVSAIDMTIVNVALPDISQDLDAGVGELQWVLDAFLVALAGLLLMGSGLADRFGRKRVFLSGMTAFGVSSVLCALAPTPEALIGARALMGASLACVMPPALSLIAVMYPAEDRQRALGVWVIVAAIGMVLGPVLGGLLVSGIGWEAVFAVNVPVVAVVVPAGLVFLPESTRPGAPPLDLPGVALSILALGAVVFALIEAPQAGWTSPLVIGMAALGLTAGTLFVRGELRRRDPLFDVRVLRRPAVAAGAACLLTCYLSFLGMLFLIPQYLQYVHDRSVVATGLLLAPLGLGTAVGSHYAPRLLASRGPRLTMAGALIGLAASTALFLVLGETTSVVVVMVGTALFAAFFTLGLQPGTGVILEDLGEAKAGDGAAVNQLARQVGGALGVAVVGTVFAGAYASNIDRELSELSTAQRDRASESIEEAGQVVRTVPEALRDSLIPRIDEAFDAAARTGFAVCVVILLLAAIFALVTLRRSG